MKKALILLLLPTNLLAANVTQAQVQQAQNASQQLIQTSQTLFAYASFLNAQFTNGFQISVTGSTSTYSMPATMQADIVDMKKYNALKAALVAEFNALP